MPVTQPHSACSASKTAIAHALCGLSVGAAGQTQMRSSASVVVDGGLARRAPRAQLQRRAARLVARAGGSGPDARHPTGRAGRRRRRGGGPAPSASSACAPVALVRAGRDQGVALQRPSRAVRMFGAMPSTSSASSLNVRSPSSRAATAAGSSDRRPGGRRRRARSCRWPPGQSRVTCNSQVDGEVMDE